LTTIDLSTVVSDLLPIIAKISPLVATSIAGPIGGIGISLLGYFFNTEINNLATTLLTDPNVSAKLQQFEALHGVDLAKINSAIEVVQAIKSKIVNIFGL